MAKPENEAYLTKTKKANPPKKQKYHKKGFDEAVDFQTPRHQRIGFKRYLEELESEELELDIDELNTDEE